MQSHMDGQSRTVWLVVGIAAALALSLIAVDNALATSEVGRNVGQEIHSWNTWLLLGVAGLFGLPILARRDAPGILIFTGIVVVIGGFVFAPAVVENVIFDLWKSFEGGK